MELEDYQSLDGDALKTKIRTLSREDLDTQLHRFGGQYALLCQRLEGIYNREARFAKIRPGGLQDIDEAMQLAEKDYQKEISLLKSFRELNRVLVPFMDVYEEQVIGDLKHMSQEELETLLHEVSEELKRADQQQQKESADYRATQNALGTMRLASLMKNSILHELKTRFGKEPTE